jgi:hypothetical protein
MVQQLGAPLSGLTGLYGGPSAMDIAQGGQYMDQGVLEARAAPGTATSHSEWGSQNLGYGGPVPAESPQDQMEVYDAGTEQDQYWDSPFDGPDASWLDKTPTTHDAPWPRGIAQMSWAEPNGAAIANTQLQLLHGSDQGGVEKMTQAAPAGHETPTDYTTDDYVAPNQSMLSQNMPGQLKGSAWGAGSSGTALVGGGGHVGGGNAGGSAADVDQGYGVNNTLPEFNAGHSIRRVQHDWMPMDYTLVPRPFAGDAEETVPFLGRHEIAQAEFDGPDSPYYAMGSIDGNQIPWEGRIGDPSPYEQPAEVTVGQPLPTSPDTDIYAWG